MGLEPMTLALLAPRSADWANGPAWIQFLSNKAFIDIFWVKAGFCIFRVGADSKGMKILKARQELSVLH